MYGGRPMVASGALVAVLEFEGSFEPEGARQSYDGKAAVVAAALDLPVVFVEDVFYRAAQDEVFACDFGLVFGAEVNGGVAGQGVGVFRVLVGFAVVLEVGVQGEALQVGGVPFNTGFGDEARAGDLLFAADFAAVVQGVVLQFGAAEAEARHGAQGLVHEVGVGVEFEAGVAFFAVVAKDVVCSNGGAGAADLVERGGGGDEAVCPVFADADFVLFGFRRFEGGSGVGVVAVYGAAGFEVAHVVAVDGDVVFRHPCGSQDGADGMGGVFAAVGAVFLNVFHNMKESDE